MLNRLQTWIEKEDFKSFLDAILTIFGAIFLASGVMFFIAYNWESLGRFFKFAAVEIAIISAFLIAYIKDEESLAYKVAVTAGSFLFGVLIALFGQNYQSGAFRYEFFLTWAILILPIALFSRFALLWLFELILIDFTIFIYSGMFMENFRENSTIMAAINLTALILFELLSKRFNYLNRAYLFRGVSILLFVCTTVDMSLLILGVHYNFLALIIYIIALIFVYDRYRQKRVDIPILSILVVSLLIVGFILFVRFSLALGGREFILQLFLYAIYVIYSSYAAIEWIKKLKKEADELK